MADVNIHELARIDVHILWFLELKDQWQYPDIDSLLSLVESSILGETKGLDAIESERKMSVGSANRHLRFYLRRRRKPGDQNLVDIATDIELCAALPGNEDGSKPCV